MTSTFSYRSLLDKFEGFLTHYFPHDTEFISVVYMWVQGIRSVSTIIYIIIIYIVLCDLNYVTKGKGGTDLIVHNKVLVPLSHFFILHY